MAIEKYSYEETKTHALHLVNSAIDELNEEYNVQSLGGPFSEITAYDILKNKDCQFVKDCVLSYVKAEGVDETSDLYKMVVSLTNII